MTSSQASAIVKATQEIDGTQAPGRMFCGKRLQSMMDETTIRVAIRTTARISFVLFLGAFLGNAFYALVPIAATRWLKDGFTLGFAGSHTVHLALAE